VNFSRIDLADCTTPEALLATIHKLQAGVFPIPVPVEEWALALDIIAVEALETEGFEGGLMMFADRNSGTILVNSRNDRRRRRFTIGHELGHFLLPWHTPRDEQGFRCSKQDMAIYRISPGGDRYMEMEAQANRFSAGLLMPAAPFRADLRARRNFEVSHVVELADRFDASKEATARRCADLHDDPIAIVISRHGKIVRIYAGKDFPRLNVWTGNPIPAASITQRSALSPGETSSWGEAPADLWLERVRGSVCEQALGQKEGFRLTLLTFEAESTDADEDDDVERAWAPPTFRRR
jgi:Zn-dependent peptidase ImmA (M78 family)